MDSGEYAIARAIPAALCLLLIVAVNFCLADIGIKWQALPVLAVEGIVLLVVLVFPFQSLWPLSGSILGGGIGGVVGLILDLLLGSMLRDFAAGLGTQPLTSMWTIVGILVGAPAGPSVGPPLARLIWRLWRAKR